MHGNSIWRQYARIVLALLMLLATSKSFAYDSITVLLSTESAASTEFVRELKSQLAARKQEPLPFRVAHLPSSLASTSTSSSNLIVAVGMQALQQAAAHSEQTDVLGVLIPRQTFLEVRAGAPVPRNISAIVLDQPVARQLSLLRQILPQASNIGMLLGSGAEDLTAQMALLAGRHQLNIVSQHIDDGENLPSALRQLLPKIDVLLATPDHQVYNRDTAKTILLTSYRHVKPVIGFSRAYVVAGALAAVFSTPEQIARQTADFIVRSASKSTALPTIQHPQHFSVATNRQVARALGIILETESLLAEKIRNEEAAP